MTAPVVYHVIIHAPGPAWKAGVGFREQPGVGDHVAYMRSLAAAGTMVFGGPFLDDAGGMAVLRVDGAEAKRIAEADPGVKAGLLTVVVHPWLVPMSNVPLPEGANR